MAVVLLSDNLVCRLSAQITIHETVVSFCQTYKQVMDFFLNYSHANGTICCFMSVKMSLLKWVSVKLQR